MNKKPFQSFDQQIQILKSRGLKFTSEETALNALKSYGYYNIINGYKDPYVHQINGEEKYLDGITFERILSLFQIDQIISFSIMNAMLRLEASLKTAAAYAISEAFSSDQQEYLKKTHYRSGKYRKDKYGNTSSQLDNILLKFNKILNDDAQPYKHYREDHHNIPPWILFKGASFGNMVNFVKLQRSNIKNRIISLMYNIPEPIVNELQEIKELFMDTLFVCLDYRNATAHGMRIYNMETKAKYRYNALLHPSIGISEADYRKGTGLTGIIPLCGSLQYFDNKSPLRTILAGCDMCLTAHTQLYPEDEEYLNSFINTSAIEFNNN